MRDNKTISLKITADAKDGIRAFTELGRRATTLRESLGRSFDQVTRSAAAASNGVRELYTNMRPLQAAIAGIGVASSVGGLVTLVQGIAKTSREITTFSTLTNTSVEQFQRWAYGARAVGIEQDKLADILKDVQDKVGDFLSTGGGELADFFTNIAPKVGVTAEQFRRLSGPEALQLYVSSLEKANISQAEMTFYLEAIANDGTLLLPLLRNNGKAMGELGDEAERLGKIMGADLVRQGLELERNLLRLQALSEGIGVSIGSKLIPEVNRLAAEFLNAQRAGLGFVETLVRLGFESAPGESAEEAIARITTRLEELRKAREEASRFVGGREEGSALIPRIDQEINSQLRALEYWKLQQANAREEQVSGQEDAAKQRLQIEQQLAAEIIRLENLRAVAAGKANADILKDEKTLQTERIKAARDALNEQLKGAERLKTELMNAWSASIDRAREAQAEAQNFLKLAKAARQSGTEKAEDSRRNAMSPEDREASLTREARDLRDKASGSAARAVIKAYEGDLVAARNLAEEAANQAARAEQLLGQLPDDRTTANLYEEFGQIREQALTAMAKVKDAESKAALEQAGALQNELASADQRISALKAELAKPVTLSLDITEAEKKIESLRERIRSLESVFSTPQKPSADEASTTVIEADTQQAESALDAVKTAVDAIPPEKTVVVKTITEGGTPSFSDSVSDWNSKVNGYATGGYISGPGTSRSDSILARLSNGEFVLKADAVRHYGLDLLQRLNSLALPRFADGGMVGGSAMSISIASTDRPEPKPLVGSTFVFPGGHQAEVLTTQDVYGAINRYFRHAVLARGSRR